MKKCLVLLLYLFVCTVALRCEMTELYKTGHLSIKPVPGFGDKTDWEELFHDNDRQLCIAPDGSIFVSNSALHNIYVFNPSGKRIRTFGRRGKGPSDFYYPLQLSVLDGKFLIVSEYATNKRISVWHLSGKVFKVLRTQYPVYGLTALKNNKLAYLSFQFLSREKITRNVLVIKDIMSGKEKIVHSADIVDRCNIGTTSYCQ